MSVRLVQRIRARSAIAVSLFGLSVYAALMLVPWPTGVLRYAIADLPQLIAVVLAMALCTLAAQRHRGRSRWCWGTLATGMAVAAVALAITTGNDLLGPNAAAKTTANILWTVATVVMLPSLLFLPVMRRHGAARAAMLLDGAIVAGSILFVAEASFLPIILSREPDLGSALSDLALMTIGVMLAAVAATVLAVAAPRARMACGLLLSGLLLDGIAGTGQTYLNVEHAYTSGQFPDIFVLAAYLSVIAAAAHVIRHPWPTVRPRSDLVGGSWLVLPYIPLAVAGGVAVRVALTTGGLQGPELLTLAILIAAVMIRQFLTLVDNERLTRALHHREAELTHLAHHDPLTGLANRRLFYNHVAAALADLGKRSTYVGLLFVDLDDFKDVNDAFGHELGDQVLRIAAERLLDSTRPRDTVARIGGDEFAILIRSVAGEADAMAIAGRVSAALRIPIALGGDTVRPMGTLGLAVTNDATMTSARLVSQADAAMYIAKLRGKDSVQLYGPDMHAAVFEGVGRHMGGLRTPTAAEMLVPTL